MTLRPIRICRVPGCGMDLNFRNTSGVCVGHIHHNGYCRCVGCGGGPVAVRRPVVDRPGVRVVIVAVSGTAQGELRHSRISLPAEPWLANGGDL